MRILAHTAISLTGGAILYNYTRSFNGFLWFLVGGILVDIDHYIDYIREKGISFDFRYIYDFCKYGYRNFNKLILLFHSYELVIALWLAIFIFKLNEIWLYATMGLMVHLLLDQMVNPVLPLTYFMCFRKINDFETSKTFINKEVHYARRHR